ncbi:flagellar basal-body rod protein FlgG [Anaeromicropila herbilytica]|uniref:Flagellar basal-body rod protein FlgG n=1 Tax=Anaeromicropila herbilytica TaxID=2785025 RepID=A0A7R7EJ25_9FIRM|nr:flagellar basal-body rod protein FlgG [Anaeromicropila herbilytica]BCN29639.1 flagellar basal-body rod protein FlgG [Anaeromicropila herbilytica]
MMRSLWTAASGMTAQQVSIDTISNNLANVNTTGYKRETAEFKSLLYQTIQDKSTDSQGNAKPVGVQVGLGVRNSAITPQFTQGILTETGNQFDFAIQGSGFFMVKLPDGSTGYTRSGSFQLTEGTDGLTLATSEGYPVLDGNGNPIVLDSNLRTSKITFDDSGKLLYPDAKGNAKELGFQIGVANFNNPAGLNKQDNSILTPTDASGEPRVEGIDTSLKPSKVVNKYLEGSNVQAVDEMVNLIVTQRAYEFNSKAITASDEMLQQANNLRR